MKVKANAEVILFGVHYYKGKTYDVTDGLGNDLIKIGFKEVN